MQSLISVIVPIYNTERYLDKCIQSILNQTHRALEIILIDDGSTDGSPSKCDNYAKLDSRIRVIHKKNGGQSSARNAGLDICRGDYIGFVDSDDWIEPEMYETLLEKLKKHDASLAVCGRYDAYEGTDNKTVGKVLGSNGVFDSYDILPHMAVGQISDFSVCDKLHRKDIWQNVRFPEGMIYEDFAVMYKVLISAKRVVLCDMPFYVYFHRKNSTVTTGFRKSLIDYTTHTQQFLSYITSGYPEYIEYAVWVHIKAIQCVLISLLKTKKEIYALYDSLYEEYVYDIIEYKKVWKTHRLFSFLDRLLCRLLIHKRLARLCFSIKTIIKQ